MSACYRIAFRKHRWIVEDAEGKRVSGYYQHQWQAEDRCEVLERKSRARSRPCMCCGETFRSEGPHHRLCATCRRGSTDAPASVGRKRARIGLSR